MMIMIIMKVPFFLKNPSSMNNDGAVETLVQIEREREQRDKKLRK